MARANAATATIKSWGQLTSGEYGIPDDATHFRWSMATTERQKMCDRGQFYALDDPTDRPGNKPSGKVVRVYPVIITDGESGQKKIEEITIKSGINGTDPIKYVTLEFSGDIEDESQSNGQTVKALTDIIGKFAVTLKEPSDALVQIIKEQKETIKEQAAYIAANEGGAIIRFLNQNPELAKEGLGIAVSLGKTFGEFAKARLTIYFDEQKEFKTYKENQKRLEGELDVSPKK